MGKASLISALGGYVAVAALVCLAIWWFKRPEPRVMVILIGSSIAALGIAAFLMNNLASRTAAVQTMKSEGLRGSAEVLQVESTNVIVQRRPQVRLRLRVTVAGKPPYEVQHTDTIALGQSVAPGQKLAVYVDRNDPQRLMIDWGAAVGASPASSTVSVRLAELQRLRDAGQISAEEFQAQRQRILSEL